MFPSRSTQQDFMQFHQQFKRKTTDRRRAIGSENHNVSVNELGWVLDFCAAGSKEHKTMKDGKEESALIENSNNLTHSICQQWFPLLRRNIGVAALLFVVPNLATVAASVHLFLSWSASLTTRSIAFCFAATRACHLWRWCQN